MPNVSAPTLALKSPHSTLVVMCAISGYWNGTHAYVRVESVQSQCITPCHGGGRKEDRVLVTLSTDRVLMCLVIA